MPSFEHAGMGSSAPGHYGPSPGQVTLAETPIRIAWNLQGDPARRSFVREAERALGLSPPVDANSTTRDDTATLLWIGPKSWLWIGHSESSPLPTLTDFEARRDALNAHGGALFDVSASRVAFTLRGAQAATVLAKACPLDLHPRSFAAGKCAQSVLGRINALLYKRDEQPTFVVMVARSFAGDVWRSLCWSAEPCGYEVVMPSSFG